MKSVGRRIRGEAKKRRGEERRGNEVRQDED
jgi:hypothetical protein